MEQFSIEIIDSKRQSIWGEPACLGEITINNFKETLVIPLVWWHQKDYKQQWLEGLERIFTHKQSALVTKIYNPNLGPTFFVDWWVLWREEEIVVIQNSIIFGKEIRTWQYPFDFETCYQHLPRKKSSFTTEVEKISEWRVSLEAVNKFLEQMRKTAKSRPMRRSIKL